MRTTNHEYHEGNFILQYHPIFTYVKKYPGVKLEFTRSKV
jgi:hypothetical protein